MVQEEFNVEQLKEFTQEEAESLRLLTKQVGKNFKSLTDQDIQEMLTSTCNNLFVVRHNGKIIAMVTLLIFRIPYVKKGYIDDLVVDEQYRGKGLGSLLMKYAVEFAKEIDVAYVDFTARPTRTASNSLYEKLGFKKRDTNVYRLIYSYDEV